MEVVSGCLARGIGIESACFEFMKRSRYAKVGLLVLATVLTLAADKFASPPVPPTAKRVPNVTEVNGHKLVDNYYWLRDKTNPGCRRISNPRTLIPTR